jgi:beta-1,4-mannosyltransferase
VGIVRALRLVAMLAIQRARGARLVWTVHNIKRHDGTRGSAERILMWAVSRLLHGVILLGDESRAPTFDAFPALRAKPCAVIPHGLYGDLYPPPPSAATARAQLDLPPDKTVIAFAGEIRPYKGVEALIEAFERISDDTCVLLLAGGFHDRRYGQLITDKIAEARRRGVQIVFREGWVSNEDMSVVVAAADFLVLPYHSSLNSGFAILTLELGARLLVPDAPVFRALQTELGPDRLSLFNGALDSKALQSAATWVTGSSPTETVRFDPERAWPAIGQATVDFYRTLGSTQAALNGEGRP